MPKYECDKCGACCKGYLIVEADEIDLLREPRLAEADPHYAGKNASEVLDILRGEIGKAIVIACGTERPCRFLRDDNTCEIYPTRPNDCVSMQAGDEQCQKAREAEGLPPLEPVEQ